MAVTVVNILYPPLIETFQPAFVYNENAPITFSLSPFNAASDIHSIHISVVDQRNNSNVLQSYMTATSQPDTDNYKYGIINGILIADFPTFEYDNIDKQTIGLFQYDPINDIYAINISPTLLNKEGKYWNNNQYYQVQIRFDSCDLISWYNDTTYILSNREYFSEWSSVTLIKPIIKPVLSITQLDTANITEIYPGNFHISGTLSFEIQQGMQNGITTETERLQAYKIVGYYNDTIIHNSDWIYARPNLLQNDNTTIDYLLDLSNFQKDDNIVITIYCRTNNGYICKEDYRLTMKDYEAYLENWRWNNNNNLSAEDIEINQEDGIIKIYFSSDCPVNSGIIYFRRACSKDNFKTWDLIYRYNKTTLDNTVTIPFDDYTVGSLYEYRYSAQMCIINQGDETWGNLIKSNIVYPKFYEMLLMRQNKQIAIRYNGQISSWKPTVNRQKIDTLGGRYPKFVENAAMNYNMYQISGLISAEEDFNRKFLSELEDVNVQNYDVEFNTEYLIRNDTAADGEKYYSTINTKKQVPFSSKYPYKENMQDKEAILLNNQHDSYPHNHWYWEREFREQLVAWLNDGEPKLYRSMPEGNIAVMLTDINLTPDSQLGRMLYNFSATMYEVGNGYSLEELDNLHIINIPKTTSIFLTDFNFDNIEDEDDDENTRISLGQTKLSTASNVNNWINGTTAYYNSANLWEDMSLWDRLNAYYEGKIQTPSNTRALMKVSNDNSMVDVAQNSIKIHNITIDFNSPPHYYRINKQTQKFELNIVNQREETSEWLGYVINIKEKGKTESYQVFINQKGYYHIPDTINVQNIQILGNQVLQEATISYQYKYKIKQAEETVSKEPKTINIFYH